MDPNYAVTNCAFFSGRMPLGKGDAGRFVLISYSIRSEVSTGLENQDKSL